MTELQSKLQAVAGSTSGTLAPIICPADLSSFAAKFGEMLRVLSFPSEQFDALALCTCTLIKDVSSTAAHVSLTLALSA